MMVYGAADNNADGPILDFLDDIRIALDDDPGMELLLFIDRSSQYSDDAEFLGENFSGARVFRIRKDSAELLNADEFFPGMSKNSEYEVDSADPANIAGFVAFGKMNFPAQKYGLMIYSHANGISMCPDDQSGNNMGIAQLSDEVPATASVDFLALELCNMAGVEIAYQWRPGNGGFSADVLVAIPNAGPPLDWDRAFARIRTPGHAASSSSALFDPAKLSPAQFGKLVVDEGYQGRLQLAQRDADPEYGDLAELLKLESAAAFDLTKAAALKQAIDVFAQQLALCDSKQVMEDLRGPVTDPKIMNYTGAGFRDNPYADLYDICRRATQADGLSTEVRKAAQAICDQMSGFVISSFGMQGHKDFLPGLNGIYMLFPDTEQWRDMRWYTPFEAAAEGDPYGRWSFLLDGAIADDGIVNNWFELLDSWHDDTSEDPGGINWYLW